MASFQERVVGALRLDPHTFEEVEADGTAMSQALLVVVAAAVATGIGAAGAGMGLLLVGVVGALVGWIVWALLTFVIGTKVLPEASTKADLGQLLRVLGFAAAPGLFGILGIIPFVGWIVRFVVFVWQLIAMVIAVRQALDYSTTGRAVLVCVIGWLAYVVIMFVFAMMFGGMASMSGLPR